MNKHNFFKSLGFSEYESKVLITLIKLQVANPKEISFDSGVPQNKLYKILKDFEKEGILSIILTEKKRYKLINLESFINNKIKEKENKLKELKRNSKFIKNLENEDEFIFSLIKGQKSIMNKLAENNSKTKKEIIGVQRNWKFWSKGAEAMKDTLKRGVDVKLIGVVNKETKKKVLEWKKIGCKVKQYNKKFGENPLRFTIFDNKEARITIGKPEISDPKNYITIWTKSKPIINVLRAQFETMWKDSEKLQ